MKNAVKFAVGFITSFGAAFAGYIFVDQAVSTWYATLIKPPGTPPDWLFGIVWTILYALMAVALGIIWTQGKPSALREGWVRFFFVQLLFNAAWTVFFFGFHATLLSLCDILILAFIIISLIAGATDLDKRASYLLTPYLLWIFYASYLNLGIWWLN